MASWEHSVRHWDVYFAAGYLLVVVSLVSDEGTPTVRRLLAAVAVTLMVPLYAFLGRGLIRAASVDWRNTAFVAAVLALYLFALVCASASGFLLFAICPLLFLTLPFRLALLVVVPANLLPPAVALVREGSAGRVLAHLGPISLMSIALSIWLGSWIRYVVRQSRERADLIDELESSRAEVARLSHEAGVSAERARLAGEIHDTLAQGFTSIVTLLQAVDSELDRDGGAARGHVALAVRTARENLAESRAMVAALAPAALGSGSLEQSVRRQVARLAEETPTAVSYQTVGTAEALPTAVEVVVLRALQEALANVRKHADARNVTVGLEYADRAVRLAVHDDGRGFDTSQAADGFGLRGMRARADQVQGTLTVHSGADMGTTIELEVPR